MKGDDLRFAVGSLNLYRACDPTRAPIEMLSEIVAILRDYLAFDMATYVEYATNIEACTDGHTALVHGRYAIDGNVQFSWPARWLKLKPGALEWLRGDKLWVDDIEVFFGSHEDMASMRNDPVTRVYLERKIRSFIVSVAKDADTPVCSLTLARKSGTPFGKGDQDILDSLRIQPILNLVRAKFQTEAKDFHREISALFSEKATPADVAHRAVRRLCEHFQWDYVAIFRVARASERFELVDQFNATDKDLLVEDGYTQPWEEGVLASVYNKRCPIRVENTRAKDRHNYKQISKDANSCLCFPVLVNDSVEWILDCESCEIAAFQQPDEAELSALIHEAERTLTLWFELHLNTALLNVIDQGVVVVDQSNRIERWNRSAANLLFTAKLDSTSNGEQPPAYDQYAITLKGRDLSKYGSDLDAQIALQHGTPFPKPIYLIQSDNGRRQVVASSCEADSAFDRRIWKFSDPVAWNWITALEYMRTTVQGVAEQTRGPLLLANALVEKASYLSRNDPLIGPLLNRIRVNLSKTDMTYERLASGLETEREPKGHPVTIDIRSTLKSYVSEFSECDQNAIKLIRERHTPVVSADPVRMKFILNSTIGYLLSARRPDAKLIIHLDGDKKFATLHMQTSVSGWVALGANLKPLETDEDTKPENLLAAAQATAHEATMHALSTVRKVIQSYGGTFDISADSDQVSICFTLPAAESRKLMTKKG